MPITRESDMGELDHSFALPSTTSESIVQHIISQYRFIEAAEIFTELVKAGQMEAAAIVRNRMDK